MSAPDTPWVTIVWNDPVNLMSYVTYVFQTYFGYPREKAEKLMIDVHNEGRAVVSSGHARGDGARRDRDARLRPLGHAAAGRLRRWALHGFRRGRAATRDRAAHRRRRAHRSCAALVDQLVELVQPGRGRAPTRTRSRRWSASAPSTETPDDPALAPAVPRRLRRRRRGRRPSSAATPSGRLRDSKLAARADRARRPSSDPTAITPHRRRGRRVARRAQRPAADPRVPGSRSTEDDQEAGRPRSPEDDPRLRPVPRSTTG